MATVSPLGMGLAALSAGPALAQTTLDRVDPGQIDRDRPARGVPKAKAPDPTTIDVPSGVASAADRGTTTVSAIAITGLQALQVSDFVDIVGQFSGNALTRKQLGDLTIFIARRARERGYPFASARIEAQRVEMGVLTVTVDEGRIDRIEVEGVSDDAVAAALAPLADGRAITLAELERRIMLTGDLPGVWVRRSRYERRGDEGVLIVDVQRQRVTARLALENDGSRAIGPEQARIDVDFNALLFSEDAFSVTYLTTPFQPDELQYGRFRYRTRVSSDGTEVAVVGSYSATAPGSNLRRLEIEGESWFVGAELRHPLWRRRDASLWLEAEVGMRTLRQYRADVLARRDRVVAYRVGLYGFAELAGGRGRGGVTVSRGLDVFGATRLGDPLASREDAPSDFTTLAGWFDWTRALGDDVSIKLAARGQLSSNPLLISEELGIGGSRFLRGYNYNERSGDQGVMGSGELRYDWRAPTGWMRNAQIYAFADGGRVANLENGRGTGSLASGGGGLRADISRTFDANIEVAVPLTGDRYDTDDADPRLNFRVVKSF